MAKLRLKNLRRVQSSLRKEIIKASRDKDIRDGVADVIVKSIQDNPVKQAELATIKWREYAKKKNPPDPKHIPDKINFTFTGELMKDLRRNAKVRTIGNSITYVIEQSDRLHKFYKNRKGRAIRPKKGKSSFKQIYKWLKKKGKKYDYLRFSSKQKAEVASYVKSALLKKLTKIKRLK